MSRCAWVGSRGIHELIHAPSVFGMAWIMHPDPRARCHVPYTRTHPSRGEKEPCALRHHRHRSISSEQCALSETHQGRGTALQTPRLKRPVKIGVDRRRGTSCQKAYRSRRGGGGGGLRDASERRESVRLRALHRFGFTAAAEHWRAGESLK